MCKRSYRSSHFFGTTDEDLLFLVRTIAEEKKGSWDVTHDVFNRIAPHNRTFDSLKCKWSKMNKAEVEQRVQQLGMEAEKEKVRTLLEETCHVRQLMLYYLS